MSSKPTVFHVEQAEQQAATRIWQKEALNRGALISCLNCEHFQKAEELCTKDGFNGRPPVKVVVLGCKNWEREIPF